MELVGFLYGGALKSGYIRLFNIIVPDSEEIESHITKKFKKYYGNFDKKFFVCRNAKNILQRIIEHTEEQSVEHTDEQSVEHTDGQSVEHTEEQNVDSNKLLLIGIDIKTVGELFETEIRSEMKESCNESNLTMKYLKKYISELDAEIQEIVESTKNDKFTTVYHFGDGCVRDDRDDMYMKILVRATLKRILEPNICDHRADLECDGCWLTKDKFKSAKKALEFTKEYCWYYKYPDYIAEHFLLKNN